jgi:hypothetical protein
MLTFHNVVIANTAIVATDPPGLLYRLLIAGNQTKPMLGDYRIPNLSVMPIMDRDEFGVTRNGFPRGNKTI